MKTLKILALVFLALFVPSISFADFTTCSTSAITATGTYPPDGGVELSNTNQKIMVAVQVSSGSLTAKVMGSLRLTGNTGGFQWKTLDTTTALTSSTGSNSNGSEYYPHNTDFYTTYKYEVSACTNTDLVCHGGANDELSCVDDSDCPGGTCSADSCHAILRICALGS